MAIGSRSILLRPPEVRPPRKESRYEAKDIRQLLMSQLLLLIAGFSLSVEAQLLSPSQQLASDMHKKIVESNTVTATGDTLSRHRNAYQRLRTSGAAARYATFNVGLSVVRLAPVRRDCSSWIANRQSGGS